MIDPEVVSEGSAYTILSKLCICTVGLTSKDSFA